LDLSENCLLIHNCLVPPVLRYHTFYLSVTETPSSLWLLLTML
jgi:hypothetical protein